MKATNLISIPNTEQSWLAMALDIKLYHIFLQGTGRPLLANNLVTVMLAIFWLSPAILLPWVYTSHLLLGISIAFLSVSYLLFNLAIPKLTKK